MKPMLSSGGQYDSLMTSYGVAVKPGIEAAFYVDLGARAIAAVEDMMADGSWPEMTYTKCKDYTSETPTPRSLDLVSAIKVGNFFLLKRLTLKELFNKRYQLFTFNRHHQFLKSGEI